MRQHRTEFELEADDNWLSRKWWQKEFPPSAHRRLRIIVYAFIFGIGISAANVVYVLLF
ncbi:MAG: hypothetical protein OXF56_07635 [Rhodobacteraceae bacterium]|nr:hypothetical protein [Paracoccaceae bacterium]